MRRGILATRQELADIRHRIGRHPFDAIHEALQRRCMLILESSPVLESHWRTTWQSGLPGAALQAARTSQGRIMDLLAGHFIESNLAYRNRAIEELQNLLSWSTWVDPCHKDMDVDLCAAEAATGVLIGLDWLWEDLKEPDRRRGIEMLQDRMIRPYLQAVSAGAWWYDCYHNWNAVINAGAGLTALALDDEDPRAAVAYQKARAGLEHFYGSLGREGGWDEGLGYWSTAMRQVLLLAEAASRLTDDQSFFHRRGMDQTGLFPVYFSPHGHAAGFGDSPAAGLYGALYLLSKYHDCPELIWWLDSYSFQHDVTISGWSAATLALLFRPQTAGTLVPDSMETLKVFGEIGWTAMADAWPRPAMYVSAKTGDLAANHSQRDMNSLQLQVDGEMFLTDPGAPEGDPNLVGEGRGGGWEIQAEAHNTITVADEDHQIDARGEVLASATGETFRWVVCDAGDACGEGVLFRRHVVMLVDPASGQGQMLVVLDELTLPAPEKISLFWHAGGPIHLDGEEKRGTIEGRRGDLHFAAWASVPMKMKAAVGVVNSHRRDYRMSLRGGVVDSARLVSVFARQSPGAVTLEQRPESVVLLAGGWQLHFAPGRRHLELREVVPAGESA